MGRLWVIKTQEGGLIMARNKNDGRGRLGGRAKGTPNKVTASTRAWLSDLLQKHRKKFERDFKDLPADKRVQVYERLLQYVLPKQQTMSVDVDLDTLTDEQLNSIIAKISDDVQELEKD